MSHGTCKISHGTWMRHFMYRRDIVQINEACHVCMSHAMYECHVPVWMSHGTCKISHSTWMRHMACPVCMSHAMYEWQDRYKFVMARVNASWHVCISRGTCQRVKTGMGWLWLVGSIKLQVSFAKEPYKRDGILQKRPLVYSILLTVATPYVWAMSLMNTPLHTWMNSFTCIKESCHTYK